MKDKLLSNRQIIEDNALELWKGHGADIDAINNAIQDVSEVILDIANQLEEEEDRVTTIGYIKEGLHGYNVALNNRDSFMMADCLYYTWREIINIFIEALVGV